MYPRLPRKLISMYVWNYCQQWKLWTRKLWGKLIFLLLEIVSCSLFPNVLKQREGNQNRLLTWKTMKMHSLFSDNILGASILGISLNQWALWVLLLCSEKMLFLHLFFMDLKHFGKHVTTFHSMLCRVNIHRSFYSALVWSFWKSIPCVWNLWKWKRKGTKRARKARESCIFWVFGFVKKDVGEWEEKWVSLFDIKHPRKERT